MSCQVFVVGSLHLDVVVDAPDLPQLDETVAGSRVNYQCGGKGGNQAMAAAHFGANTGMAARLGPDEFGGKLLAGLREGGVGVEQIQKGRGASGMSVAIVNQHGAYGAVIVSGENLQLDASVIAFPKAARVLLLQNEIPEAVNLEMARQAQALGVKVLLNAAPARPVGPELMALVNILIVNRIEAEGLLKARGKMAQKPEEQAKALMDLGARAALITLGAQGLVYNGGDGVEFRQAAPKVTQVSSHGAGDVFAGALGGELARGQGLEAATRFAQNAAALHVMTPVEARGAITRGLVDRLGT